jgi:hypothetical protein
LHHAYADMTQSVASSLPQHDDNEAADHRAAAHLSRSLISTTYGGQALAGGMRASLENTLGTDLSAVRLHTGAASEKIASGLGRHVALATGNLDDDKQRDTENARNDDVKSAFVKTMLHTDAGADGATAIRAGAVKGNKDLASVNDGAWLGYLDRLRSEWFEPLEAEVGAEAALEQLAGPRRK